MIFIAKNEDGIPSWKLALEGKKTVTRRIKSLPVGKEFAIQPGRGKFAVCRAKVISCSTSLSHWRYNIGRNIKEYKQKEAQLEGFNSWDSVMKFLQKKDIQFRNTYRIEFERLN